jgi:cell wall-associated NlpC family hydrolase
MTGLDRRLNAIRDDLADAALRGSVAAPRFAEGVTRRVAASAAPVRRRPASDAPLDTQALHGETVRVFEEEEGWAWAQLQADGYVGYLPAADLAPEGPAATHRVGVLRSFVFPGPDLKLPPLDHLPLGARVTVAGEQNGYAALAGGGFVHAGHLAPVEARAADFVAVAESMLGVPYLWGGKTPIGLDCSGLVQLSLAMAGIAAPRDSDMQEAGLGAILETDASLTGLRRGDLVFWKGHVGIMTDPATLLHANAHHMLVAREKLAEAVARIAARGSQVTCIRRP